MFVRAPYAHHRTDAGANESELFVFMVFAVYCASYALRTTPKRPHTAAAAAVRSLRVSFRDVRWLCSSDGMVVRKFQKFIRVAAVNRASAALAYTKRAQ